MTAPAALAACIAFDDQLRGVGESAAKMPPLWNQRTPPAKIAFQSKSPGFSCAAASLRAVVKDHRRAHAVAAVAVNGRHVRAGDAVVLEMLVERLHAHGAHALGDQIADRIIDHRGGDAGLQAESSPRGWRRQLNSPPLT